MATAEMKFTKGALDDATHLGGQATRYRDPRYPNLYLEVGARSKTWRFRKFWKGQNFTETLGTWPQMGVIEAAQTAAEFNTKIEDTGVLVRTDAPRNAPEVTLRRVARARRAVNCSICWGARRRPWRDRHDAHGERIAFQRRAAAGR